MRKAENKHAWAFAPRFRRGAYGWRSEPAITRIKEAISEIKAVARKDPLLAAEGAILFLQKVSPAIQNIDGSSGAISTSVNRAIETLVHIIAQAPAELPRRRRWLEQLYQAHADDEIPYIESLGDYWGELCATPELAAEWADQLSNTVSTVWSRSKSERGFFHGTSMCLSALLAAGRSEQLLDLLAKCPYPFWTYRQWGVKALVSLGRKTEALHYAEATRGLNEPAGQIARACEGILLSSGLSEEAYQRYAFEANQAGTHLATFRAICKKYPDRRPESILMDLATRTPGQEGKWFAAAKDAKLYDLAVTLAWKSPVDHRTLMRAAEGFATTQPHFAVNCGVLALHWICAGEAYEATTDEVLTLYGHILQAAEIAQCVEAAMTQIRYVLDAFPQDRLVRLALAQALELRLVAR